MGKKKRGHFKLYESTLFCGMIVYVFRSIATLVQGGAPCGA